LPGVPIVLAPVLGVLTIVAGLLLLRHVRRYPRPVLNLSLFRERGFTPAATTVLFSNLTMYTILSLPLFLNGRDHWSSGEVGLLLGGLSVQMSIFSPVGGWLADRSGRRVPAVAGTVLLALGALPLVLISDG
jgi:MFS family permease